MVFAKYRKDHQQEGFDMSVNISTNEVFNTLLHLTGCGRDPSLALEIFKLGGVNNASLSKIKAWRMVAEGKNKQDMPRQVLDGFTDGLFKYRDQENKAGRSLFYTENITIKTK